MAKVNRLRDVPGIVALRLRSEFGDDRHSGGCASCAYFDTYARMFGRTPAMVSASADHIRRDHEPVG